MGEKTKIVLPVKTAEDRKAMVIALANKGFKVCILNEKSGYDVERYVAFEIPEDVIEKPREPTHTITPQTDGFRLDPVSGGEDEATKARTLDMVVGRAAFAVDMRFSQFIDAENSNPLRRPTRDELATIILKYISPATDAMPSTRCKDCFDSDCPYLDDERLGESYKCFKRTFDEAEAVETKDEAARVNSVTEGDEPTETESAVCRAALRIYDQIHQDEIMSSHGIFKTIMAELNQLRSTTPEPKPQCKDSADEMQPSSESLKDGLIPTEGPRLSYGDAGMAVSRAANHMHDVLNHDKLHGRETLSSSEIYGIVMRELARQRPSPENEAYNTGEPQLLPEFLEEVAKQAGAIIHGRIRFHAGITLVEVTHIVETALKRPRPARE